MTDDRTTPELHDTLLIDDLRVFRESDVPVTIARTSRDGVDILRTAHDAGHQWEQIWLDHDLGDATGTNDVIGPVVDWLCQQALAGATVEVDAIIVHTTNVAGGDAMARSLQRVGYRTVRIRASEYLDVDEGLYAEALRRSPEGPTL